MFEQSDVQTLYLFYQVFKPMNSTIDPNAVCSNAIDSFIVHYDNPTLNCVQKICAFKLMGILNNVNMIIKELMDLEKIPAQCRGFQHARIARDLWQDFKRGRYISNADPLSTNLLSINLLSINQLIQAIECAMKIDQNTYNDIQAKCGVDFFGKILRCDAMTRIFDIYDMVDKNFRNADQRMWERAMLHIFTLVPVEQVYRTISTMQRGKIQ
jgi:hypothetical protein